MSDATLLSADIADSVTFMVNKNVLKNLRNELHYANEAYAEQGEFSPGHDTVRFLSFDDLSSSTTPMSEGVRPDKRKLVMGAVDLATDQHGGLLSIGDVAQSITPIDLVPVGTERLTRESREVIDKVTRDVIALGGTPSYANGVAGRASVAANAAVADLRKLKWKMFNANIPLPADGYYRLMVSPGVSHDLATDSNFIDAVKYTDRMPLLLNEVGSIAGFRIISVQNAPTVSNGSTVHLSIAFGDIKGWASGDIQTLRSYFVAPGGDHTDPLAQETLLGWKCMFGVAVLDNGRYFRYESLATDVS